MVEKKKCLRAIVLGALISFIYGWEVFSGNASTKYWGYFIFGLGMLIYGLLLCFGIIKNNIQKSPKEDHAGFVGLCVGWGCCTIYGWLENNCAFDPHTIASFIILAIFIFVTFIRKGNIPKGE